MKKCICDNYRLTFGDLVLMAPSRKRKPGSINCPVCKQEIRATKKSKAIFVAILVVFFIGLGFSSAFWIIAEQGFWVIAAIGVGLGAHYLIIWPHIIELESTAHGET